MAGGWLGRDNGRAVTELYDADLLLFNTVALAGFSLRRTPYFASFSITVSWLVLLITICGRSRYSVILPLHFTDLPLRLSTSGNTFVFSEKITAENGCLGKGLSKFRFTV